MKLHLHHFSKIKIQKESQNSRNQGFSYYFCIIIEGSGSRAGSGSESKPLTSESGSGSWRPKNTWIRIRNTDMIDCDLFLSFLGQARDYQLLPVWESICLPHLKLYCGGCNPVAAVNNFALDAPVIMEDQASERYHLEIQHLRQQLHESHSMVGIFLYTLQPRIRIRNRFCF